MNKIIMPEGLPPAPGEPGYDEYLEEAMNRPPFSMPPGPYERTGAKNWYPNASKVVQTPKTIMIPVRYDLIFLIDNMMPKGYDELLDELDKAAQEIGYPVFFRSGQTSAKHYWDNARCIVRSREDFLEAIPWLVNHSAMGWPEQSWETLMVREVIPTAPICHAFDGMPVTREFRLFIEDGKISHIQPYWPRHSIEEHTRDSGWEEAHRKSQGMSKAEYDFLAAETMKIGNVLPGNWSVDWLQDRDGGWWMIDMADASVSYRWEPDFNIVEEREMEKKMAQNSESMARHFEDSGNFLLDIMRDMGINSISGDFYTRMTFEGENSTDKYADSSFDIDGTKESWLPLTNQLDSDFRGTSFLVEAGRTFHDEGENLRELVENLAEVNNSFADAFRRCLDLHRSLPERYDEGIDQEQAVQTFFEVRFCITKEKDDESLSVSLDVTYFSDPEFQEYGSMQVCTLPPDEFMDRETFEARVKEGLGDILPEQEEKTGVSPTV